MDKIDERSGMGVVLSKGYSAVNARNPVTGAVNMPKKGRSRRCMLTQHLG
ncbi:hypothetical protein GCM10007385_44150 [Tateyamaria omphalii]|nr:hypothetical protein GCM10007385_44150 [Tateyamaria omphalii]